MARLKLVSRKPTASQVQIAVFSSESTLEDNTEQLPPAAGQAERNSGMTDSSSEEEAADFDQPDPSETEEAGNINRSDSSTDEEAEEPIQSDPSKGDHVDSRGPPPTSTAEENEICQSKIAQTTVGEVCVTSRSQQPVAEDQQTEMQYYAPHSPPSPPPTCGLGSKKGLIH